MDKLSDMTMEQPIEQLAQQADIIMANLHFVRADWFYAFIPLVLFLLLSYWKKQDDKNWLPVIDKALLPFVLTKLSLIHISEPTRRACRSRMPSSA